MDRRGFLGAMAGLALVPLAPVLRLSEPRTMPMVTLHQGGVLRNATVEGVTILVDDARTPSTYGLWMKRRGVTLENCTVLPDGRGHRRLEDR